VEAQKDRYELRYLAPVSVPKKNIHGKNIQCANILVKPYEALVRAVFVRVKNVDTTPNPTICSAAGDCGIGWFSVAQRNPSGPSVDGRIISVRFNNGSDRWGRRAEMIVAIEKKEGAPKLTDLRIDRTWYCKE
jgi:hypothetical protein